MMMMMVIIIPHPSRVGCNPFRCYDIFPLLLVRFGNSALSCVYWWFQTSVIVHLLYNHFSVFMVSVHRAVPRQICCNVIVL
jgi:hypothetical protein